MLVISGPNAGGKSITLKTIGLLQLMLQSGLLVPVAPDSQMCFFKQIYSDIGDNQSIENELSTYSYRLQRMKFFLSRANAQTLLLLDEFGTGSDPELGAALAEVFFEQMYVLSSTRATSLGSEQAKYEFFLLAGLSFFRVPAATIPAHNRSYSSSEPSHQYICSGCVRAATSATQSINF